MSWLKYKKIYLIFSAILVLLSLFSLLMWKLKPGIDFTGGTVIEYRFSRVVQENDIYNIFLENNSENLTLHTSDNINYSLNLGPLSPEDKKGIDQGLQVLDSDVQELKFELVGPSIGPELTKKTIYALLFSAGVILLWVAYQFKNVKYGLSAVFAMAHDSIILLGAFSLLGHFWGIEIDFLFVTAVLTVLSFSVHDTIVVFDRIREVKKRSHGSISDIADEAISQTMVRSLNNSFTIIFMLVSLVLLGGDSIRWFSVALLIGTISGTYSSPFVAVPLLVTLHGLKFKSLSALRQKI